MSGLPGLLSGAGGAAGRHATGACLQPRCRGLTALGALHDVLRQRPLLDVDEHAGRYRRGAGRLRYEVRGLVEGIRVCAVGRSVGLVGVVDVWLWL